MRTFFFSRLFLGIALIAALTGIGAGTWAAPAEIVSYTQSLDDATTDFSFPPANVCGGQPRTIHLTSRGSFRITMAVSGPDAGDYWISPLQRGTFQIPAGDAGEPAYSGTFELQTDDETPQLHKGQVTFFLHHVGFGSDGSELNTRLLEQLTVSEQKVTLSMATPIFLASHVPCA